MSHAPPRSVSSEEFEEYQRQREEPIEDGDIDGQRRKINASFWVAYCYIWDTGGEQYDLGRGIHILEQVVQEQDSIANDNLHDMTGKHRCLLAWCLQFHGEDGSRQLFRQAVPRLQYEEQMDGGDEFGESSFLLGFCFRMGWGVEKDRKKGLYWLTRASERGSKMAQLYITNSICSKNNVASEEKEMILDSLHQQANTQERAWAQRALGEFYSSGGCAEKDLVRAVEWYNKAIARGDEQALGLKCTLLDSLEAEEHNRVLGCVERNKNIEKARRLTSPSTHQVPLGLWPLAIEAFQQETYPLWEAPSPTYLLMCGVAPQLQNCSPTTNEMPLAGYQPFRRFNPRNWVPRRRRKQPNSSCP